VNTSSATSTLADPATVTPSLGTLPDPNTANSAADVDNASSVVQNLSQCGDQCSAASTQAVGAVGTTAPVQGAGTSKATAVQQAPSNVDVSIRVASPGADGLATQLNGADGEGETVVATTTTPNDVVVSVVVPGSPNDVAVPTGDTPWIWNWTWTTGQAPTDPTATPTSSSTWQWTWTAPAAGATPAAATANGSAQAQSGQWTWTWDWTRPDGTTTSWTYSQACSCSWAWTWTWNWPASTTSNAPAAAPTAAPAPPANPTVDQRNESSATAVAVTTFTGTQSAAVTTDSTSAASTSADQAIGSDQEATAAADVAQTRPLNANVVTAGEIDGVDQANSVVGTSVANVADESIQSVTQQQSGTNDGASHSLSAVQRIETVQSAHAGVVAGQTDAGNLNQVWSIFGPSKAKLGKVTQKNVAETLAIADVTSAVQQVIHQSQAGGGADQDAAATQSASTAQAQSAFSAVSQARVANVNAVAIPLNGSWNAQNLGSSQTTLAAADAEALALAETSQQLDQFGFSLGGTQVQWAGQQTSLVQMAGGVALVGQSGARGGASALASTSAAAKAITIQGAEQKAIGGFGLRSQRSAQLAVVNQLGTSTATTTDSTSEHTNREASSKAIALNAGLVEQRAAQELTEGSLISIQDSTQQTSLVQVAHSYSPSLGGKAGTATVVNWATVRQASGQVMGCPVVVGTADHSTFCFPPEPAAPAQRGEEGETPGAAIQVTTIVHGSVVDVEPRRGYGVYVGVEPRRGYGVYLGVDRGARPELSGARGFAPSLSLTAGGPPAPPLGACAPVACTPQVSAAIVSAPPSGHDSKAVVRDHAEQLLQWPRGLLVEVRSGGSIVLGGGGGMAVAIAASRPAVLTGWRVVAGSVVRRPTHFALRRDRPG
jgi:hypothetical protein